MKKVLIITYYWPPSGGAGVQRWLKFVKYLRSFGWEPIIYTPENPEMPVEDKSLLKDVPPDLIILKTPVWEPYTIYKKFVGQKKGEKINTGFLTENKKPKLAEKIAVWIRGNLFIPDARKFWIKPSINYLAAYLKTNPVDVVISSGPPHSMHLIALGLKKRMGIKWVADFRDPWTNIDFYKDLMLTSGSDRKHKALEKEVLMNADKVISIGNTMNDELVELLRSYTGNLQPKKFEVITNGYDEEDIAGEKPTPDKKFSIAHIGTMVRTRNPHVLWKALSELVKNDNAFANALEIKLVGKLDISVKQSITEAGLDNYVNKIEYLPHNEVIREQQKSQVLLLMVNQTPNAKGILTGKFFEYLAAARPVLCIGPNEGDLAEIIRETNCGNICNYDDVNTMKNILIDYFQRYQQGALSVKSTNVNKYSRYNLTEKLSKTLQF